MENKLILNVRNLTTDNTTILAFENVGNLLEHVRLFCSKPHFDANVICEGKVTHRGFAEITNLENWF